MSDDSSSGRSSISTSSDTKSRFDSFRRQLSAHIDKDMTGDDTLAYLLDEFEDEYDWVDLGGNDS